MQKRHTTMLKQQQMQSEILLKQIQTQMESEVKIKNELIRHQISLLGDIHIQTPTDFGYVTGLMEKFRREKTGQAGSM